MSLPDELVALIDERVATLLPKLLASGVIGTASGTVAERSGPTTAKVTLDGSGLAVPLKVFGDVNIEPGDRVGLVRIGADWTIVGTFSRRRQISMPDDATTGTMRMVWGGDTPPELVAYGITVAAIFYVTDVATGEEVGYLFIGVSNEMDAGADIRAMVFGNVSYPTAGVPESATSANVKTNFQCNMWAQSPQTVYKDHHIKGFSGVDVILNQGRFESFGNATFNEILAGSAPGDTQHRYMLHRDGKIEWGPGNAVRDLTAARTAAGELTITGDLLVTGIGGLKYARKTSDETVNNSSALQDDNDLSVSLPANSTVECELRIKQNSGATPGFKCSFTLPSGATWVDAFFICGSSAANQQFGVQPTASLSGVTGAGADSVVYIRFTLTTTTAGTLQLQWAQNAANASNTIVRAGGTLTARVVQ